MTAGGTDGDIHCAGRGIHGALTRRDVKRAALEFRVWQFLKLADEKTALKDIAAAVGVSSDTVRRVMHRRGGRLPRWVEAGTSNVARLTARDRREEVPDVVDLMGAG